MSDCVFCKIIKKELPSETVYEDDEIIAFNDISPKARVHILVVPKKHIVSIAALKEKDRDIAGKSLLRAKIIAEELGINKSGYKIVSNVGDDGGQLVPHLHFHLLGGEKLTGLI